MAGPKKTAKVASKNSPTTRRGAVIATYKGTQVVKVKASIRDESGKMLSVSYAAKRDDAIAGKSTLFIMVNGSPLPWKDVKLNP